MFWPDGYTALDALDDDRDGRQSGRELDGLAVWTDANGDGVSDPGEVVPVESAGVVSIATRWANRDGRHPHQPAGLRTADGQVRPTWDWVVEPAGRPAVQAVVQRTNKVGPLAAGDVLSPEGAEAP